jgi:hypothetical protein
MAQPSLCKQHESLRERIALLSERYYDNLGGGLFLIQLRGMGGGLVGEKKKDDG